ncbi:MAG TPA: bifunctional DNA-formamidopyrimidine glycosylase/DNA-(apurinic or apyrimidinic site) lyase [Mariprofundaceae bacterium]|nr:bifunctional DNA-formamidopyrimidine glycosylase/DNA-(apurinic or apyrimidinic site) lyase [Mariprofundaceae bacterium]
MNSDIFYPLREGGACSCYHLPMPELPEVEVVCRGLEPLLVGRRVQQIEVMCHQLRYPLPAELASLLSGLTIQRVKRRAKYLLFCFDSDLILIWHLGMTGQFHLLGSREPKALHEHVRIGLSGGKSLCYRDARRFGYAGLTTVEKLQEHPWFSRLGPEPLSDDFTADTLYAISRGRKTPIKTLLMNNEVVVGVGNIYASESLFRSGIHPARACGRISLKRMGELVSAIKSVLAEAIEAGGSTISDFVKADGKPGYFAHQFRVYGRAGAGCYRCGEPVRRMVQSGRSSFYCPVCQH